MLDRVLKIGGVAGFLYLLLSINADALPNQPWARLGFLFIVVVVSVGVEVRAWLHLRTRQWLLLTAPISLLLTSILVWWSESRTKPLKPKFVQCQAERISGRRILLRQVRGSYESGTRPWSDFVSVLFVQLEGLTEQILISDQGAPAVARSWPDAFEFPLIENPLPPSSRQTKLLTMKVATLFQRDLARIRQLHGVRMADGVILVASLPLPKDEIRHIVYADDPCVVDLAALEEAPVPPSPLRAPSNDVAQITTHMPISSTGHQGEVMPNPDLRSPPPDMTPPRVLPDLAPLPIQPRSTDLRPQERIQIYVHPPEIQRRPLPTPAGSGDVERQRARFESQYAAASVHGRNNPHSRATMEGLPSLIREAIALADKGDPEPACTMRQVVDQFASMNVEVYCPHVLPSIKDLLPRLGRACPFFRPQIDPVTRCD